MMQIEYSLRHYCCRNSLTMNLILTEEPLNLLARSSRKCFGLLTDEGIRRKKINQVGIIIL